MPYAIIKPGVEIHFSDPITIRVSSGEAPLSNREAALLCVYALGTLARTSNKPDLDATSNDLMARVAKGDFE